MLSHFQKGLNLKQSDYVNLLSMALQSDPMTRELQTSVQTLNGTTAGNSMLSPPLATM